MKLKVLEDNNTFINMYYLGEPAVSYYIEDGNDKILQNTIKYFKDNNIKLLYPCHCVSLEAKIEITKQMKVNEVGVGLEIDIE